GIGGAVTQWLRQPRQRSYAQLAGPAVLVALGGAGIACAVVFLTEAVSVLFGLDYANLKRGAETLPDFALMGLNWGPLSPLTWGLPLVLMVGGILALRRGVRRLTDAEPTFNSNAAKEGLTV
ncbi:MAG: hypothetical protein VX378_07720, partial [Pseudomonadota bacterium]|nr:hypothetical protein [Pseudomonadota bacterium]